MVESQRGSVGEMKPDQGHDEAGGVHPGGTPYPHECLQLRIPELLVHVAIDRVARGAPFGQRGGERPLHRHADAPVYSHPAQDPGIEKLPPAAPHLPDSVIGLPPIGGHPIHQGGDSSPEIVAGGLLVLVVEVDGIEQLAIDVELQLVRGGVTDPHRARAAVALQVIERPLGDLTPPGDGVQRLERLRVGGLEASGQPPDERAGLLGHPEAGQGVQREGGVPDPGESVIPVAHSTDGLGQAEGRRGHDRSAPAGVEQLERERGPMDLVSPPAGVGGQSHPVAPEVHGRLERFLHVVVEVGRVLRLAVLLLQDERGGLPGPQREDAHRVGAIRVERDGGREPQHRSVGAIEHRPIPVQHDRVGGAGVVEAGGASHLVLDLTSHRLHPPHQSAGVLLGMDRHEVGDLHHTLGGEEPGEQHVGVGQVELLVPRLVESGDDLEASSCVGVEQAGEDRGGVEVWKAEEIHGPVQRNQRGRLEIPDDGVRLDRGVSPVFAPGHCCDTAITSLMPSPPLARWQNCAIG